MPEQQSTNKKRTWQAGSEAILPNWMQFPTLAAAFDPSPSATIAYLNARQKEYQALETTGMGTDRVRARLIVASYARASELLKELEAARTKIVDQQAADLSEADKRP